MARSPTVLDDRNSVDGTTPPGWPPVDLLRPSEYTALLIQALRTTSAQIPGAHVLEMGSGSGVALAAAGGLGAARLSGIDIEPEAIASGTRLLHTLGHGAIAEFFCGDMWHPVAGRTFDLVIANLPHFPTEATAFANRFPSWSRGGPDGRDLLDRFLDELAAHLAPGGRAIITHNAFVDIARSRRLTARHDLSLRISMTTLLYIPTEKFDRMTDSVRRTETGRTIHCYGSHAFGELHIVEIGAPETIG